MRLPWSICAGAVLLYATACKQEQTYSDGVSTVPLVLESPVIKPGGPIPLKYTCAGQGISPPLSWSAPPLQTQSLVLVLEKVGMTQAETSGRPSNTLLWLVYNIPPSRTMLPEALDVREDFYGAETVPRLGVNHFGNPGYDGPCPSSREPGRYVFNIFALDTVFDSSREISNGMLTEEARRHILAEGILDGIFAPRSIVE